MTLSGDVNALATRVGQEIKAVRAQIAGSQALVAPIDTINITSATTRKFRKAVSNVRLGTGPCKVMMAGDSTMWGQYANSIVTDSPPGVVLSTLAGRGHPVAQGLIGPASATAVGTDSRWTLGTGWSRNSGQGLGDNGALMATTTTGGKLRFTPGVLCDRVDVYYLQNSSAGTFTYQVNGGAGTNVNATNDTAATGKITITLPSGANNYVEFTQVSSTILIFAAEAYQAATHRIRIGNVGVSSSTAAMWATDTVPYESLGILRAYAPDLTFVMLGINDGGASVTQSAFSTSIQAIINAAKVSGDVILVSAFPSQNTTTAGFEEQYAAAMVSLTASAGVGMIDLHRHYIDWATANARGLAYDAAHPNTAGSADMGRRFAIALEYILAA